MEKICGVYGIKNVKSGKMYIGKSVDVYRRWRSHFVKLGKGIHINPHLQSSYNKYGESFFVCGVIEQCARDVIDRREKDIVLEYNTVKEGYNVKVPNGEGGLVWTAQQRKSWGKLVKARNLKLSPEQKYKRSQQVKEWHRQNLHPRAKKVKVYNTNGDFIAEYSSAVEAALAMRMRENRVRDCIYGKKGARTRFLKYKGFIFLREGETIEKRLERIVVETNTPNAAC